MKPISGLMFIMYGKWVKINVQAFWLITHANILTHILKATKHWSCKNYYFCQLVYNTFHAISSILLKSGLQSYILFNN